MPARPAKAQTTPPATATDFVYLASASPRRTQLLQQLGVPHQLLLPDDDEDTEALEAERAGETPADYVQRVTLAKLHAARQRLARRDLPPGRILTADTTVALGRCIFGKPADAAEASVILHSLSGRTHRVLTAVAVGSGRRTFTALNISQVRFAKLGPAVIQRYIDSGEPFGKAGAYAVQGLMAAFIERITGSHSGIMGLPLFETAQLLAQAGLPPPLARR